MPTPPLVAAAQQDIHVTFGQSRVRLSFDSFNKCCLCRSVGSVHATISWAGYRSYLEIHPRGSIVLLCNINRPRKVILRYAWIF